MSIAMALRDSEGHSPTASLFRCDFYHAMLCGICCGPVSVCLSVHRKLVLYYIYIVNISSQKQCPGTLVS